MCRPGRPAAAEPQGHAVGPGAVCCWRPTGCFLSRGATPNFTRDAHELCVTQGADSHQVKALEAELRLKLFQTRAPGAGYD